MGDFDPWPLGRGESSVKYHPYLTKILTLFKQKTVPVWQFDWGGSLLKSNGEAQRYLQCAWKPHVECKGIWVLDCEVDKLNRHESGA